MFLRVVLRFPSSASILVAVSLAEATCTAIVWISKCVPTERRVAQAAASSCWRCSGLQPLPSRLAIPCTLPPSPLPSLLSKRPERTHGLALESVNRLELGLHIVVDGLERLEELLSLGDDILVLEEGAVVLKVDRLGRRRVGRVSEASIGSALAEGGEGRQGLCWRAGGQFCSLV